MRLISLICCAGLALSACSTIYRSSSILPGTRQGTEVRVVALDPATVLEANQTPYAPKSLPDAYKESAGTAAGRSGRGVGSLPNAPSTQTGARNQELTVTRPPRIQPSPYRVGVGDVVMLATPSTRNTLEELTGLLAAQNSRNGYTVQDDGAINIPDVGRARIAGLTIEEAEELLFQKLVEAQFDPTFSLEIVEFNSQRVAVGGAVGKPAVLPITLTPLRLSEALTAAGSVSATNIDVTTVRLYRAGEVYQIPLKALYERPDLQAIRLISGDSIFVDSDFDINRAERFFEQQIRLKSISLAARAQELSELNSAIAQKREDNAEKRAAFEAREALGATERDFVYLTGEFDTRTRYPLPYEQQATLADALFDAGGGISRETGDVSQVYVLRASSDPRVPEEVTAWHLNARSAANYILATKFELRPDDVIFVAENPVTKWGRTLRQITPSLITTPVAAAVN
ncbi:polysaccharide biosynthesis/export family protein [Phaeobacter sp.]|uniref:polysaccharide biosynthesis/export family protein n=1 Tax=Phaeobacter sp. TaxID=1902409 RepID=UPI0025D25D76|nr:polysaccharide biosynthesis/export family protein [Phaeobacter sp.]